jgi:hypothetical protein
MRATITAVGAAILMIINVAQAHANKRVALVVGNDHYVNLPAHEQLQKAVNDARAVGKTLRQLGFEVLVGENLPRHEFVDKLDVLSRRLSPGDTVFFFFSGHGVTVNGANYILPTDVPDIEADQERRLARTALSEHDILLDLQSRGVRVAVVVLDACRTNPFHPAGEKGVGGAKGLAPPEPVRGVFSLYAAGNGQAALDRLYDGDSDPNSVFTRVLLPELRRPGIDLTTLALDVREEVARLAQIAGRDQRPAYYDETLGGRIYLTGLPPAEDARSATSPPPLAPEAAQRAWLAVQNSTSTAVLEEFRRQYPSSPFDRFAAARIQELKKKQQVALVAPPVQPAVSATSSRSTDVLRFDGTWYGELTCGATTEGSPGWHYQFPGRVSNGKFHAELGVAGTPGYQTFDGTIDRDGGMVMALSGIRDEGSTFHDAYVGKFDTSHGKASRNDRRSCLIIFTKV